MSNPDAAFRRLVEVLDRLKIPFLFYAVKRELDRAYLRRWAAHLIVEDLLDRALAQSAP